MKNFMFGLLLISSCSSFAASLKIEPTKEVTLVSGVQTGGGSILYKVKVFEDKERNVTCYIAYGEIGGEITRDNLGGAGVISINNPNIACLKN